jgi:16S rRNA (guanine966-N2)-methyltransferase
MGLKDTSTKKLRKRKKQWRVQSAEDFEAREEHFLKEELRKKEPTITGSVRITGGSVKNMNVDIPKSAKPLSDRMKIRIFDILNTDIVGKRVLDLFAGSGSFGFEALSRGASECMFVEASKHAEGIIRANGNKLGFNSKFKVTKSKVDDYLNKPARRDDEYDIIFIDPPYKLFNKKQLHKIEEVINKSAIMLPGMKEKDTKQWKGAYIVKHPRQYPIDKLALRNLKIVESYPFGLTAITIFIVASNVKSV